MHVLSRAFLRAFSISVPALIACTALPAYAQTSKSTTPATKNAPAAAKPAATAKPTVPAEPRTSKPLDRIAAVVNDEVITERELDARTLLAAEQLQRQKIQAPSNDVLRKQVLERMITDRAQLQLAKETGVRVDDATVNAAIGRIAETNSVTLQQLRARLEQDGLSFARFRDDIRDDITMGRLREREVDSKVQITDSELDSFIAEQAGVSSDGEEYHVAQILLRVPENAGPDRIEETRVRANELAAQIKGGADFARLAASYSNAADALTGGDLGWRSPERLPNLFVEAMKNLKAGEVAPVVRSPNGFHILKLLGKRSAVDAKLAAGPVQQTHVRHILLRVTDLTPEPEVKRRLEEFRQRIIAGQADFAQLARLHSVDPSGTRGGDLGWVYPGDTVPEFERAMNNLKINEVSEPIQSPFGWHLIQVLERKTEQTSTERTRMTARQALRERKADEAYQDWLRQLRDKTYVEYRLDDAA